MKKSIKELVEICAKNLDLPEPIHEFGAYQVKGQEGFADLRKIFPAKKYVGSDMRKGPGVDIIIDLHNINLPNKSIGTALLLETLEHVEYPHKAMDEIYRVLKRNGVVIITSQMNFPIHNHPQDFWRYTPDAFKSLMKPYKTIFVSYAGHKGFPHTVIGVGFKKSNINLNKFKKSLIPWQKKWFYQRGTKIPNFTEVIASPFIVNIYKKLIKHEV